MRVWVRRWEDGEEKGEGTEGGKGMEMRLMWEIRVP